MGNSNLLFESIFKRKLSDAGTSDYLTEVTNEHPYFSPAQFFLLLQAEKGTEQYVARVAKTSALFNNPYWLQFQLQEKDESAVEITDPLVTADSLTTPAETPETVPEPPGTIELAVEKQLIEIDHGEANLNPSSPAPITAQVHPMQPEKPAADNSATQGNQIDQPSSLPVSEMHVTIGGGDIPEGVSTDKLNGAPVNDTAKAGGQTDHPISIEYQDDAAEKREINEELTDSIPYEDPDANVEKIEDEIGISSPTSHFNNDSSPLVNETEIEEEIVTDTEIQPLKFKLNIDTTGTTEENITFEPLHTSDYFASQGIKLSGEVKSGDKLGKQLKSFTEWLKTMKKIQGDQVAPLTEHTDKSIQKLAEQSNKDDTIATEAMAEVLLQQGKAGKAIEVYRKLSLLNPSKSTYFAAKIDQLKES